MRTVSWGMQESARDPLYDEQYVMKKFHGHVAHCSDCHDNLTSWHSGRPLCSRGQSYVLDMNPYFFCRDGKPYSKIDQEKRDERNRVLVPSEFKYVTVLFEALKHGYNTGPAAPRPRAKVVLHHQQPAQQPQRYEHRRAADPIIIPAERHHVERTPRSHYREERHHRVPRRGSLYHEDQRRGRYHQDAEYVVAAPRYYR